MNNALFLIPLLTAVSAAILYRQNGKKEILKFDLVQFLYAFVFFPLLFIWIKTFIFLLFKNELFVHFSSGQLFMVDTILSTFFLYIYAFIVIHSLTKSFELKRKFDPFYDLFQHSEYFHLWLSHLVIYGGILMLLAIISLLNISVPAHFAASRLMFGAILFSALVVGFSFFCSVFFYESPNPSFMKIMKLLFGCFFLIDVLGYFLFQPSFSMDYIFYWYTFTIFLTLIVCSFSSQRSQKAKRLLHRLKYKAARKVSPVSV